MSDQFTEVNNVSWFSRLGQSIRGVLFGLVLFVAAFPLLAWNEGRTVKQTRALNEGARNVISTSAGSVDATLEGQLVHISGLAETNDSLQDSQFGIAISDAIKLRRVVEMYQWQESSRTETRTRVGGGEEQVTTYSYTQVWSASLNDSSRFREQAGHQNPGTMPYTSEDFSATNVNVGAYQLSDSLIRSISGAQALPLNQASIDAIGASTRTIVQSAFDGVYLAYAGTGPNSPAVGDLRVRFEVVPESNVSILAKQQGNSFVPYEARNGNTINMLHMGVKTADEMIETAKAGNQTMAWLLRALGFVLMIAGLSAVFAPLAVVGDVIPFFGKLIRLGTGAVAGVLAFFFAFITIALAWIAYRPMIGFSLIGAALIIVFIAWSAGRSRKARVAVPQESLAS